MWKLTKKFSDATQRKKIAELGPKRLKIATTAKNQKVRKQKFYKMKVISEP